MVMTSTAHTILPGLSSDKNALQFRARFIIPILGRFRHLYDGVVLMLNQCSMNVKDFEEYFKINTHITSFIIFQYFDKNNYY